ncbi:MAG: SDR family NAD(P)-dependent oxidoreductase, partial [Bradyrhizobium sp.]
MTEQHSTDWLGLSGRIAVVTGGGGGIGRATAVSFARAGVKVAALDRDERGLAETKTQLRAFGDGHLVANCDTTSEEGVAAAAEAVARTLGACDILVNTAAVLRPGGLDTLPLA